MRSALTKTRMVRWVAFVGLIIIASETTARTYRQILDRNVSQIEIDVVNGERKARRIYIRNFFIDCTIESDVIAASHINPPIGVDGPVAVPGQLAVKGDFSKILARADELQKSLASVVPKSFRVSPADASDQTLDLTQAKIEAVSHSPKKSYMIRLAINAFESELNTICDLNSPR